ncbi:unnamed protein product [Urochloa decumbens]|uniref:Bifunctional inhibitor/plant lipid transfer protein/seed storage helical domain-containing protein n=1 Tax=Urochloa decumbens TaxID=240449 RepID=A0ABC8YU06_9POAL
MMRPAVFLLVAVLASLLASRAVADFSALAPCDVMQLSPCASAFAGKGSPTPSCCARLKSHGPNCLCRYKDDANLKRLVDTRNKRRVFTACKVPVPSC